MFELASPLLWIGIAAGLLAGSALGWFGQRASQRRRDGGRDVAAMQREIEEYRAEVNEHFTHSAELFKEMTERYRDVYEHLADGANLLCSGESATAELEEVQRRLLAPRDPESAAAQRLAREGLIPDDGSGSAA